MAENLLTVRQAATRLHVHPITVRRYLRSGSLRGIKSGHLWRVPESAISETSPTVSPLVRAVALIRERDAHEGQIQIRQNGSAATDLQTIRGV